MAARAFVAGTQFSIENTDFTLLRKISETTWQAEEKLTKRIQEFSNHELFAFYLKRRLVFKSNSQLAIAPNRKKAHDDLPDDLWKSAKIRRAYVEAVLHCPATRYRVEPILSEVWEKLEKPAKPPCFSTVIRWKKKYLDASKDIRSLIDKNSVKGNRSKRVDALIDEIIDQAIEEIYLRKERGTIQQTLEYAISLVIRENSLRPTSLHLDEPSRRHIKTKINKIPAFDRYAARHGHTAAVMHFRSVKGHFTTQAPLARAEIDHTRFDLLVIDDETLMPLGRPWLTVCLDDYTRSVLGICISFNPPSFRTVARCLMHAFMPKTNMTDIYPSIKNQWHSFGVMDELVVDNGLEFHSDSLENVCYTLGTEIIYAPRKSGWFKGKVERFLGTLNREISHNSPGTTFSNIFEKGDYDPAKHATISYSVLKEMTTKWITDVYHQKTHSIIEASPANMWASSIAPEEIRLPDRPDEIESLLGKSENRVLTHKGIEIFSLLYNSPELTALRRQQGDKIKVEIRINEDDLGSINVLHPISKEPIKAYALKQEYANGLSSWQHDVIKSYVKKYKKEQNSEEWITAKQEIIELVRNERGIKKKRTRAKAARFAEDMPKKTGAISSQLSLEIPESNETPSESVISNHINTPRFPTKNTTFEPKIRNR